MITKTKLIAGLAPALALALATPAFAEGKGDRAQEAIAAAQAKIESARTAGAGMETPHQLADAENMLANAKEDVSAGKKEDAIMAANRAAALADASIGESQRRRHDMMAAHDAANQEQVQQAQATAQQAQAQAQDAQASAEAARAQAADANARAAAADSAAAAAATAPAQPTAVQTTVTTTDSDTSTHGTVHHRAHHVVHHTTVAPATSSETTRTTVTTQAQ